MNTNALRAPTPVSMQPQPSPADRAPQPQPQPQPAAKPFAEMLQRSRDGSAAAAVKAAATASPSTPPKAHVDAPVTADEGSAGTAPDTARPRARAAAPPAPSRAPATSHSAASTHAADGAEADGDSDTNHEADAGRGLTAPSAAATAAHTAATAAAVAQAVPISATDASSQAAAQLAASARGHAADTEPDRAAGLDGDSASGSDMKAGAGQKHRVDGDDMLRSLAGRRGDGGHDVGDTKAAAAFALATAEGAAPAAVPHALPGGDLVVGTAVAAGVTAGEAHSGGVEAMPSASAPLSLPTPIDSPDFAASFGLQVSLLTQGGVQQAELHLNPADMGPVSIHIALDGKEARIDFGADLAATRQAIEHGLPELAGALRDAGFTLAGGGVSQHASERQGSGEGSNGRGGDRDPRAAFRTLPASDAPALARALRHAAAGGVDLYA